VDDYCWRCRQRAAYKKLAVTSILYFVLLFASLFYPLGPLPKWFRAAALANPITWQIDCLRWAKIGVGNAQLVAMESIAFIVFSSR
jgi:hypothetical protein